MLVSYRSLGTIDAALESVRDAVTSGEAKVVLVDNDPADGTAAHVRQHYPFVEVRSPGANLGFGRGCNHGAAGATTPYLLLLNPDATLGRDALGEMTRFLDERPEVGIVAPYIAGHRVGAVSTPLDVVRRSVGKERHDILREVQANEPRFETQWVSGAVLLVRRDLFECLGGFDPRFFLYFEETDLCVRTAQLGFQIWVLPDVHATHTAGVSAAQSGKVKVGESIPEFFFASRFYYMKKHHGAAQAIAAEGFELALLAARALASRVGLRNKDKASGLRWRLRGTLFRTPPLP